jgi:pimeloyl-ACP methyl ester carboxylesterase
VRQWSWVMEKLPDWVACIGMDLPGHGTSRGTFPVRACDATARILSALAEIGVAGPAAVAGHSMGGVIALDMAVRQPASVSHLALIATGCSVRLHPVLHRQLRASSFDEGFIRMGFSSSVPEERIRIVLEDLACTRLAPCGVGLAPTWDAGPGLERVAVRTAVIAAQGDAVVSVRKSRDLARRIPDARLTVLESGHYLHIEQPVAVAAELIALLDPDVSSGPPVSVAGRRGTQ